MSSFSLCQWALRPEVSSWSSAELRLDGSAALLRALVLFLGQRPFFDLELEGAALELVDLGRHRVDLDAQPRGRLVDQVDGLVGQEAVGDVAVGERGGRHQSGVGDANAVVDLVLLLEAAQDGDGLLDRRLVRPAPAGSGARGRRPFRCTCGTR